MSDYNAQGRVVTESGPGVSSSPEETAPDDRKVKRADPRIQLAKGEYGIVEGKAWVNPETGELGYDGAGRVTPFTKVTGTITTTGDGVVNGWGFGTKGVSVGIPGLSYSGFEVNFFGNYGHPQTNGAFDGLADADGTTLYTPYIQIGGQLTLFAGPFNSGIIIPMKVKIPLPEGRIDPEAYAGFCEDSNLCPDEGALINKK